MRCTHEFGKNHETGEKKLMSWRTRLVTREVTHELSDCEIVTNCDEESHGSRKFSGNLVEINLVEI